MSRAAVNNPDRRREIREVQIPLDLHMLFEPGARAFTMGACRILLGKQRAGWHLSISREDKLPSWEEVRWARYELIPDEAVMVMLLPPMREYVNVHEYCFQLYEIPREYIDKKQDRL